MFSIMNLQIPQFFEDLLQYQFYLNKEIYTRLKNKNNLQNKQHFEEIILNLLNQKLFNQL